MRHAKAFQDLGQERELVLKAWLSLVNASDRLQPPALTNLQTLSQADDVDSGNTV